MFWSKTRNWCTSYTSCGYRIESLRDYRTCNTITLLRGTILNRAYATHKSLHIYLFLLCLLTKFGPIYLLWSPAIGWQDNTPLVGRFSKGFLDNGEYRAYWIRRAMRHMQPSRRNISKATIFVVCVPLKACFTGKTDLEIVSGGVFSWL